MNDLELIITRDKSSVGKGYRVYKFTPTVTRLFYRDYEKMTFQRRVRFLLELMKGYAVYYLTVDDEIVAYCVVSKGGGRYSFAGKSDIFIGPYFVLEEYRGKRYSEILVSELVRYEKIRYQYAFGWVKKTNIPSLKCTDAVGLKIISTADVVKPFRRIVSRKDDSGAFYIVRGEREDLIARSNAFLGDPEC